MFIGWYDGHSGGVTPVPIPNTEVKPACVAFCTVVREPTGIWLRCRHPILFLLLLHFHPSTDERMAFWARGFSVATARPLADVRLARLMSRALAFLLVVTVGLFAGCVGEQTGPDGGPDDRDDGPAGRPFELVPLSFPDAQTGVREEIFQVTVDPQDACIPAGCIVWTVSGSNDPPPVAKVIDISALLPVGTHAFVEARATWDRSLPVSFLGNMNLQWFTFDVVITGQSADNMEGESTLSGFVTNHGPAPAQLILVVLEPEGIHEPVEVEVEVRVSYLHDAVHEGHVVAVPLKAGRVPMAVHLEAPDTSATFHVRDPTGEPVLVKNVAHNETVFVDVRAAGEHRVFLFGNDRPARLFAGPENVTAARMTPVDTTGEATIRSESPEPGEHTWTVSLDAPPYWIGVVLDALDGRSQHFSGSITLTAPDGTVLVEAGMDCTVCYSYNRLHGGWGLAAYTAGEYTFTVAVDSAVGWRIGDVVGVYS
jgi:hypothetical protein